MALYETVFIARQDVSAKQVEDLANAFAKIVNDNGGDVKNTESWGLRNLAYKIKKNRKGHYTLFHMDAPPAAVVEMERNMKLNEDVLRYMTVRIDALPEGPSPILKQSDDDDRGSRGGDRGYRRDRNRSSNNSSNSNDDSNDDSNDSSDDDSSEGDE
ncbi:MAG: 30S ribosomal protein S6 [Alphaproteobacteria bacterium]|nr:30S ribosomal protein S6 [Alphaproteobacteria bacterium]